MEDVYSVSKFIEYMRPTRLVCENRAKGSYGRVFRSERIDESSKSCSEMILQLLRRLRETFGDYRLVQFWALKSIGNRHVLTSADQPFLLHTLETKLCFYKRECVFRNINLEVIKHPLPDSTPGVKYCSLEDFPQWDLAELGHIESLYAFPVFEVDEKRWIGVLEVVADCLQLPFRDEIQKEFHKVGLTVKNRWYSKNNVEHLKRKRQEKEELMVDEKNKGVKLQISYEELEQHFGKPLKEVAGILGVSHSTIKRQCIEYGILRWPSNKNTVKLDEGYDSSGTPSDTGSYVHDNRPTPDARVVTIKASYGQRPLIKFFLHSTSKLTDLQEEVAKRLDLEVGSFEMTYHDDEDVILICCDEDLRLCMETMTSSITTTIKMSVMLKSN